MDQDSDLGEFWRHVQSEEGLGVIPEDEEVNPLDGYVQYRKDLHRGLRNSGKALEDIDREMSREFGRSKRKILVSPLVRSSERTVSSPKSVQGEDAEFVMDQVKEYKDKVMHRVECGEEEGSFPFYVSGSIVGDAWSRRWYNLAKYDTKRSRAAVSVLSNKVYKKLLKVVVVTHMCLAFFEPASTWKDPSSECGGEYSNFSAQLAIECIILSIYLVAAFLMFASHISGTLKKSVSSNGEKGRKTYPFIFLVISLIMVFDLFIRASIWFSSSKAVAVYSISRPLRPIMLLVITRPLRQLCTTISKVLPSVFWLCGLGATVIFAYSLLGVRLFVNLYPHHEFDVWSQASMAMFVLFTTENYPTIMWPAVEHSSVFFIYFLSFLVIAAAFFVCMLGLVYDSYRQTVLRTAFRNFCKERLGLTAAFAMISEHVKGEEIISIKSWTRLVPFLPIHLPRSKAVSMYMSVLHSRSMNNHVQEPLDAKSPGHLRSISDVQVVLQSEMDEDNVQGGLDLISFYKLCDEVRVGVDLHKDEPIRNAKKAWLNLLRAVLVSQGLEPVENWQRSPSQSDDLPFLFQHFESTFAAVPGLRRVELRSVFRGNIEYLEKLFGESVDTEPLRRRIDRNVVEWIISFWLWRNLVKLLIIGNVFLFAIVGFEGLLEKEYAQNAVMLINLGFLAIYLIDELAHVFVLGVYHLLSLWTISDIILITLSLLGSMGWLIPSVRNSFGSAELRTAASCIVLRSVRVCLELVSGSRRQRKQWLALKGMVLHSFRIGLLMLWTIVVLFYVYSIIGMELFSCSSMKVSPDPENVLTFDSFPKSLLVLFQIVVTDNWHELMYAANNATSLFASLYFISFYLLNSLVILNLFSALVVEALVSVSSRTPTEAEKYLQDHNTFDLYTRFLS